MYKNPVRHFSFRLLVPSGVTARFTYFDFLNRSTIFSVRLEPFFLAGTGMPPNALNIYLRGKKNQNSFIRKLAFLPNDRYAARPRIKSQFDVWGATQITHLSRRGAVTDTFHPLHFNSLPHMFMRKLCYFATASLLAFFTFSGIALLKEVTA